MKILIIGYSFYPEKTPRAFRGFELAKEWEKQGHEVHLAFPFTNLQHIKNKFHDKNWVFHPLKTGFFKNKHGKKQVINNDFQQGPTTLLHKFLKSVFHWIYPAGSIFEFAIVVCYFLTKNKAKYDSIFSIGLPVSTHWGVSLARIFTPSICKKWIADYGDPFSNSQEFKTYWNERFIEKWTLKKCDFVTIPTITASSSFNKILPENKIRIIPQGVDLNLQQNVTPSNEIPTFAFAGVFYRENRDPTFFFEALSKINIPFQFVLYTHINSTFLDEILSKYDKSLLSKIIIHPMVEREECIKILAKMDFLINFENNSKNQTPSKLIDYGLANRPIASFNKENFKTSEFTLFLKTDYSISRTIDLKLFDIKKIAKDIINL